MAEFIRFTEHLISNQFDYAYGLSTADFTGNGFLDLVAADKNVGLYWFENDGQGNFTRHIIRQRVGEWLERHMIADINGDGQPEIVIIDNINGSVLWFGYQGDPKHPQSWYHHYIIEGELPGAYDVAVADFDGDGDLDVAASSWRKGNRFSWYENRDGHWVTHLIEDNMAETRTICAVDITGNGRPDLIGTASAGNQVVWYENPGDPVHESWIKHIIDTPNRPMHGHPVDMDGDGDVDFIMAGGLEAPNDSANPGMHQVVWYEHDGDPRHGPWQKHVIWDGLHMGFEAVAADLDGDGHMEVVATGWGPNGCIAVFKHEGDPRGPWSMQMLKAGWIRANSVLVADMDGDGRLDIVACAEIGSNELRWWRNEGPV